MAREASGPVHVGRGEARSRRNIDRAGDFDVLLNLGGRVTLVVVPYTLVVDGLLIAFDAFGLGPAALLHGTVALVWSVVLYTVVLYTVGIRTTMGIRTDPALVAVIVGEAASLPLLALFAR